MSNWNPLNVQAGDKVRVVTAFGSGNVVIGVVEEVEKDVKNGRPGISYHVIGYPDNGSWAYMDQVTSKVL